MQLKKMPASPALLARRRDDELAVAHATISQHKLTITQLNEQLSEVTATAHAHAAELRVLRRQRQQDADALRSSEQARRELEERQRDQLAQLTAHKQRAVELAAEAEMSGLQSARKVADRRQSKQARADKAILVGALEALADELARARADARKHAAAAESAQASAQKLAQIAQAQQALLDEHAAADSPSRVSPEQRRTPVRTWADGV